MRPSAYDVSLIRDCQVFVRRGVGHLRRREAVGVASLVNGRDAWDRGQARHGLSCSRRRPPGPVSAVRLGGSRRSARGGILARPAAASVRWHVVSVGIALMGEKLSLHDDARSSDRDGKNCTFKRS